MTTFKSLYISSLIEAIILRLLKDSRHQKVLSLLDKMLITYPDILEFHHYRGIALCGLGRLDESILSYERALQL
jgi:tetratricopeptide (TPR) repeat protein